MKKLLNSHDGIHDSQTHLASPPYFYEQLRRELSLSARIKKPLALIKIVFDNPKSEQVRAFDVLHFSHELSKLTREEDCVGRLGVNEVVIIVRDGQSNTEPFVQRLLAATSLTVDHTLQVRIASTLAREQESALEFLRRLDQIPLSVGK